MEINLRQNMGTVALHLRKLLHPNTKGMWRVKRFSSPEALVVFHNEMQKQHPVQWNDNKILKGYFPLVEPKDKLHLVFLLAE